MNSKADKFFIAIASLPDRDQLVAEILYEGVQWAEISQKNHDLTIQFYSHPRKKYWEFSLEQAMEVLQQAKQKLLNLGPTRADSRLINDG